MSDEERRSERLGDKPSLDYKKLSTTGERVLKPPTLKLPGDTSAITPDTAQSSTHNIHEKELIEKVDAIHFDDTPRLNTTIETITSESEYSSLDSVLNVTAISFPKDEEPVMTLVNGEHELLSKLNLVTENLTDYIDENSMHPSESCYYTIEDVETCISRVETFRTVMREMNQNMKDLVGETKFLEKYNSTLTKNLGVIKTYIKAAKGKKGELRSSTTKLELQDRQGKVNQEYENQVQKQATAKFLISEVTRMIKTLNIEFIKDNDCHVEDEEIESRKGQLAGHLREAENISNKFQRILETTPESYPNKAQVISELIKNYDVVVKNKGIYEKTLLEQVKVRELEKEKLSVSVDIKLQKFSGFTSELDIYSFKSEFEKISKKMPSSKLPDLLKHNYLANPALAMVKSLDKINEIWDRLQQAYGDPQTILSKLS